MIKRTLYSLICLVSILSFVAAYHDKDMSELEAIEQVENVTARPFMIPNDLLFADPEEIYPLLYQSAYEAGANIFRSNIHFQADGQMEILKYVLLTGKTSFFDRFRLAGGRWFTADDSQQDNFYISSKNTGDKNQIGRIKDFGGNNLISIKPLKRSYDQFPTEGVYYAETTDDAAFNAFLQHIAAKFNEKYRDYLDHPLTGQNFIKNESGSSAVNAGSLLNYLRYINHVIFLVILLLLIYHVFNESKKIGIIKLHGISNLRLWFMIIGRIIAILFIVSTSLAIAVALLITDTSTEFVGSALTSQMTTYLIIIILSTAAYLYISRIRVSDAVKSRKDTTGIFALNTIIKAVCAITLVLVAFVIINKYVEFSMKQSNLQNWEQSKDYGIFYPFKIGYDREDLIKGCGTTQTAIRSELYPILNRMGSILIDARMYEEQVLIANKDFTGIRSIKVNPNYLRKFTVYDFQQQPIQVSEETSDWILLVPEKYSSMENEILSFYQRERKGGKYGYDYTPGWYESEEHYFKRPVPDKIRNQPIRIIWLSNEQQVFSFNPDVFPAEHNMIVDPIIQVMTEQNSVLLERNLILGGGASDPLKISLLDRDSLSTYKTLEPELKRLHLDDNLEHLVTVNQNIFMEIYKFSRVVREYIFISIGLFIAFLVLTIQNLSIFFNKYQHRFIVRRLFGFSFGRSYQEYFFLFGGLWALQILAFIIIDRTFNPYLIGVAAGLITFELAATVFALRIIEHKNKVKVLKGGA